MHTRHWVVLAVGAIVAVFGITGQEVADASQVIAALLALAGVDFAIAKKRGE